MAELDLYDIACRLSALSVFRGILEKAPMQALTEYLNLVSAQPSGDESYTKFLTLRATELFGRFVHSLAEYDYSFSDFLCRAVFEDENVYITGTAQKRQLPASVSENARAELELFSLLSGLNSDTLAGSLGYSGYIPQFESRKVDFPAVYAERLHNIGRYGYGVFASAAMFRLEDKTIVPVEAADDIRLESFIGYENERRAVYENTKALTENRPAANVLLYGDAGTGKSSTVKACVNHFFDDGVRLIELRKDQLFTLPYVMGRITGNPLKFIIFIDDLSFNKNDDSFSMLKAALEGSASAKAANAVIYATSNRRHIVKETFSDRSATDDVHRNDTVQELMSLSNRFGLTVYFSKPDKALYLEIIHRLAERNGITIENGELDVKAEAFALAKGSRSPRAAEQFINSLM